MHQSTQAEKNCLDDSTHDELIIREKLLGGGMQHEPRGEENAEKEQYAFIWASAGLVHAAEKER